MTGSQLIFNDPAPGAERQTFFADVMLPVPIAQLFTYRLPQAMEKQAQPGCRVIVQFGKNKILTGIIGSIHHTPPAKYETRYVMELLDEQPIVNPIQLQLYQWMADYYMCTVGEVMNAAIPSGLKLSSQSQLQLHPGFDWDSTPYEFSERERRLIDVLEGQDTVTYSDAAKILELKGIHRIIKGLIEKEAVLIYEQVKDRYKPKTVKRVRLQAEWVSDEKTLEALLESLAGRPKQEEVLLAYMAEVPVYNQPELNTAGLAKKKITDRLKSNSPLTTLVKHGIMEEFEVVVSRFGDVTTVPTYELTLSHEQEQAAQEILAHFETINTVLLHGITGSGKTEIYIHLIRQALAGGSQVLYMLPEIALTTQIVNRLRLVFGDAMGIYHSRFSDNERVEVWQGVLTGRFQLVVGVRSSVFLPFDNLGLVLIDEEHEPSYKQYDPAPRYHGRDVALMLAHMQHAKVLLGTATPSVETYYHTQTGKYGLVELLSRYGNAPLPEMTLADLARERKQKTMQADFTSQLVNALRDTLERKEQAIVFQNRRGYSNYVQCQECGHIPKCENCAVSLTYHYQQQELRCHYCGFTEPMHRQCEVCGATHLKTQGYGTEKLEEDLMLIFPEARIQRMDLDTTRGKHGYQRIIERFEAGDIDILVGTQMVSKGLDFDKVSLVGIMDIDRLIHFPDFRSHERAYQLITQVAGRAGRRNTKGLVVVQSANTSQPLLQKALTQEYGGLYREEIGEREQYHYPPFYRLIRLTLKHQQQEQVRQAAAALALQLVQFLGQERVLGPEEPMINRIRNQYLMNVLIKVERPAKMQAVKSMLREKVLDLQQHSQHKQVSVVFDVDPQ